MRIWQPCCHATSTVRSCPALASAHFTVQGTMDQPGVHGTVEIAHASIASQPFDTLRGDVDYAGRRLAVSKAQARIGGASVEWSATYTHAAGNWRQGALRVKLAAADLLLSGLTHWKSVMPAADGHLNAQLEGSAEVDEKGVRVRELLALAESLDVALGKRPLGLVRFRATTTGDTLEIRPLAELAGAGISGIVRMGLEAAQSVEGELQFRRLSLSTLRAWWSQENTEPLPVEAYSEGKLTFRGKGFDADALAGARRRRSARNQAAHRATNSKLEELGLRNAEPIVLEGTLGEWRISRARLLGHETNLEIGGKVSLGAKGRFDLRFRGGVDLAILHDFEKDLAAAGTSELDAEVRGPLDDPGLYGRLKLINASLYFSGVPNGIDKANGTVFFDRHRATIESLTAQTGGGTLSVSGFVGFGGADRVYRLQATAKQVRVRYPEGVSTTMNAALNLTGTASRSLLAGTVSVSRSSINPRMDFAGLLAHSSQSVVTPAMSNDLLRGMQFDVRIETVPNARLETTLTRDIQIEANLRLRGTPAKPILLGRISSTQGELNFFGNKYNIARGEVSFVNPVQTGTGGEPGPGNTHPRHRRYREPRRAAQQVEHDLPLGPAAAIAGTHGLAHRRPRAVQQSQRRGPPVRLRTRLAAGGRQRHFSGKRSPRPSPAACSASSASAASRSIRNCAASTTTRRPVSPSSSRSPRTSPSPTSRTSTRASNRSLACNGT